MHRNRAPITFSKLAVMWFSALTVVTIAAACAWFVTTVRAGVSPMAGEWMGNCQDGKPLVMLYLKPTANGYGGLISVGDVKITSSPSAAEGSCVVNDPASPEHSMKISRAVLAGGVLTIYSDRGQEFEMKLADGGTAKLRFVGTNRDESWFVLRRVVK